MSIRLRPRTSLGVVWTETTTEVPAGVQADNLESRSLTLARRVLTFLVPTTTIVALLYYFGYIYAQSFYLEFRLDETGFGLTTSEYLTRSANVVVDSVLFLAIILAAAVATHVVVEWTLDRAGFGRSRVGLGVGTGILVIGLTLLIVASLPGGAGLSLSSARAMWLLGAVLMIYGGYLGWRSAREKLAVVRGLRMLSGPEAAAVGAAAILACFGLVVYGAFELTRAYAIERGRDVALWVEQNCEIYSLVRVYSTVNLNLDHRGVSHAVLRGSEGDFSHRYDGLRQFDLDGARYLMWPATSSPRDGVFALPNDERIRVEPAERSDKVCPEATP